LDSAAWADHGFDAMVIGVFERVFDQRQRRKGIAELHAYGVHV
jgi:hypothetical protein